MCCTETIFCQTCGDIAVEKMQCTNGTCSSLQNDKGKFKQVLICSGCTETSFFQDTVSSMFCKHSASSRCGKCVKYRQFSTESDSTRSGSFETTWTSSRDEDQDSSCQISENPGPFSPRFASKVSTLLSSFISASNSSKHSIPNSRVKASDR
jgi:hypothetical protein